MTTTLLAAFPSPSQGVWHLGPVPLRAYALFIIVGIIAALVIGDRRWEARGGERGVIYDIALWAVPFGLIGGRLYHVLTDWPTYFGPNGAGPAAALRIWDGGLGIWGAVALGAVGAWIACKRRGIPLPAFGDAIAPGIVLAQAIGRLGNYFNQELYGRPTDVPWGLEIFYRVDPSGIIDVHSLNGVSNGQVAAVVHPTFLYELICNLLVFALLLYVDKRYKIGHGRLFALYVAGYCVGRFAVELMRDDFATLIAGVRINTFTATFVFIGAIVYFILAPKGREAPETLRGNAVDDDAGDVGSESRRPAETVEKELAKAAATTGVVAATTVALKEDESESKADTDSESDPENDWPFSSEPDSEPDDAPVEDDAAVTESGPQSEPQDEAVDDEALVEAEVTADPALAVETVAEAEEEQLIDEDHDPVDDEDLESLQDEVAGVAEQGPVSEQLEELDAPDAKADVDEQAADEEEAAEGEALIEAEAEAAADEPETEAAVDEPEDEADFEAGVAADPAMAIETDAEAEGQLIDEDHDPVDDEDLESLQDDVAVVAEQGPVSEQQEELDAPDAKPDVDEQAADEEEAAEGEALVVEAEDPDTEDPDTEDPAEEDDPDTDGETSDVETAASDYVVVTTPPPASSQPQGSRLGRLLRRRR